MDHATDRNRSYVLGLLGLLSVLLSGVFAINAVVDPLWHFRGNRLGDMSYRFEERIMKLNYFLNNSDEYDCLIFGSSRATLLDESLLDSWRCYNLSFSLGHVREFVLIAEYLSSRGYGPARVIVGIDEVSFQPRAYTNGENLPEYVVAKERPRIAIEDYLGITPLRFSLKNLLNPSPFMRAYERRDDGSYRGVLLWRGRTYEPGQNGIVTPEHMEPYDPAMLEEFAALRRVFPDAVYVAYVPPISDWEQAKIDLTGNLEHYVAFRHRMAPLFDGGYWDFSVPCGITPGERLALDDEHDDESVKRLIALHIDGGYQDFPVPCEITAARSLTPDGLHYDESVNRLIAECLNGDFEHCGPDVRTLSLEDYRDRVLVPVRSRIKREGLSVTLGRHKPERQTDAP